MKNENMKTIETVLEDINDLIKIQGADGDWNDSAYMCGLYNGLLLARSVITNESPDFRNVPRETLWFKFKKWNSYRKIRKTMTSESSNAMEQQQQ